MSPRTGDYWFLDCSDPEEAVGIRGVSRDCFGERESCGCPEQWCTFDAHAHLDRGPGPERTEGTTANLHWELKVKAQSSVMFFQESWQSSSHPLLPTT